jgi:hypothetical protein
MAIDGDRRQLRLDPALEPRDLVVSTRPGQKLCDLDRDASAIDDEFRVDRPTGSSLSARPRDDLGFVTRAAEMRHQSVQCVVLEGG